jgi:non-ribosomal peptide synthetase component F
MEYWEKRLADTPGVTKLPIERPDPPVQTLGGAQQELRMPASLVQELHVLCSRQKVTLFMVLLAAWATLLHRYSGEVDILISTPFANRNRGEVEGLIGLFSNVVMLRQDLSADPSFAELLGRVRETAFDAFSHGELPLEKLVEELRPNVQVMFTLLNAPHSSLKLDGLQVERIEIDRDRSTPFLRLHMIEGDNGLTAWLYYNTHLFEAITVARMLEHFRSLLENIVTDPEQHLSKLPLPIKEVGGSQTGFVKRLRRAVRRARRTAGRLRARIKNGPFFG